MEKCHLQILLLNQAGFTDYWIKSNRSISVLKRKTPPKPLSLVNLSSVFITWLMCIASAICIFCCESVFNNSHFF